MLRKLWAFYKRDWQLQLTYRFTLLTDVARTLALLISFFFIGRLFSGSEIHPHLATYGGDYFRFVFLGIAFSGFMNTALQSISETIRMEWGNGTLEAIFLTPTSFTNAALGRVLSDLSLVMGKVTIYLLIGVFLFRVDLSQANWITVLPVVLLTVSAFLGLGLFSAGFYLLTREASPLERILGWGSQLLGGVYFPVTLLPEGLKQISLWLPLTSTLEAVRKLLLQRGTLHEVGRELSVLLLLSLVILPAGFLFFRWALGQARHRGNLSLGE